MSAFAPALTSTIRSNSTEPESDTSDELVRVDLAGGLLSKPVDVELSTVVFFTSVVDELDTPVKFPPTMLLSTTFNFLEAETDAFRSTARSASRKT